MVEASRQRLLVLFIILDELGESLYLRIEVHLTHSEFLNCYQVKQTIHSCNMIKWSSLKSLRIILVAIGMKR
jgi:hypothetical protein